MLHLLYISIALTIGAANWLVAASCFPPAPVPALYAFFAFGWAGLEVMEWLEERRRIRQQKGQQ